MAAITISWNDAVPAGSENIKTGDNRIVEFKQGIVQRLRNGGHQWQAIGSGATTDVTDGRHCCGESNAAGSTEAAGTFTIYAADTTTALIVFRDSTATPASEVDFGALKIKTTGTVQCGPLTATGAALFQSTVNLGGATTVSGGIAPVSTAANIDLGNSGAKFRDAWLSGAAQIAGNAFVGGTLNVTGVATFTAVPVFSGGVNLGAVTASGTLTIQAAQVTSYTNSPASGTYTVLSTDRVILCKITNSLTIDLPAVASSNGRELWVVLATDSGGPHTVSINPNASETIEQWDGSMSATSLALTSATTSGSKHGVHIVCDGSAWYFLAVKTVP